MHEIQNFKEVKLSLGPKNTAKTVDFVNNKNNSSSNNKIMNLDIYNINRHHNQNTTLNYCNTQTSKGDKTSYDNENILFNDNINNLYDSGKNFPANSYRNKKKNVILNSKYSPHSIID